MFIQPTNILRIQEELKRYRELCSEYQISPAKDEFREIINFLLLQSGTGTGTLTESTFNYLFDDFIEKLNSLNEKNS